MNRGLKRFLQALIGFCIGAGLLWVLFRNTDWREVTRAMGAIHPGWFLLTQVPLWLSFPVRVQRWTYIVRAARPATFRQLFAATQIGFLANFTLPVPRVGEAVRALVLTRLTAIPFSQALAMVALDRVTDLFGLMAIVAVALVAYRPGGVVAIPAEAFGTERPIEFAASHYQAGAIGVAVFMVLIIAAFVALYLNRRLVLRINDAVLGVFSDRLARYVHGLIDHFADGLHVFRSPADMAKSIAWSLATWACAVLIAYCMLEAFGVTYPWYTPFVMQVLLAVAIAAPGTVGFVGQYHFPLVLTLVMLAPETDVNTALAFAILAHLINYPPLILTGVYCLLTERLGLFELGRAGMAASK